MTLRGWAAVGGLGALALLLGWWHLGTDAVSAKAPSEELAAEDTASPALPQFPLAPAAHASRAERAAEGSQILASAADRKPRRPSLAKGALPALRGAAPNRAAASSPVVAKKLASRSAMADTLNARLARRIDRLTELRDRATGAEQARLNEQLAALSANQAERQRWANGFQPERPLKK